MTMTTTTVTPRSGELMAQVLDPKKAEATFSDPEKAQAWVSDYSAAQEREQKEVVDKAIAEFAATIGEITQRESLPAATLHAVRAENYNPDALGAKVEDVFDSRKDFYQAVWDKQTNAELVRRREASNAIATTGDGGTLVPESMRSEFITASLESAVVRPRATVIPMATSRVKIPVVDSTTNVGSVFGGVIVYNTAEEGTLTASQPKFANIVLDASKVTALVGVNREMMQDSAISVPGLLDQMVPQAIGHKEDYDFFQGNGVGVPLGFLNDGNKALIGVAKETGQAADTVVYENIVKMFARLLPGAYARSIWTVSPDVLPQLMTMGLVVGTGGSAVFNPSATDTPDMRLLGRPIVITEKANKVGDKGDISLVDLSYYFVGDRQQLDVMASEHYAFATDQVFYRFIERIDGRPGVLSAITPKNGGATLSPFVTLNAR